MRRGLKQTSNLEVSFESERPSYLVLVYYNTDQYYSILRGNSVVYGFIVLQSIVRIVLQSIVRSAPPAPDFFGLLPE